MTTEAIPFTQSSIGKKAVMALSGAILFGFVVSHLIGNLQVFQGPEKINEYAAMLRRFPALLWGARLALLFAVMAHIGSAAQLYFQKKAARPEKYRYAPRRQVTTYAARTMYWGGPIILVFIIYHLLHFTFGSAHPDFVEGDVYRNVIIGFSNPLVSAFYILAQIMVGLHLYHGLWSACQTLSAKGIGRDHRWDQRIGHVAKAVAILIAVGNISIPVAVMAKIIHL